MAVEAAREMNAWLDHPAIGSHYFLRSRLEGLPWYEWVPRHLGGPANRSLDLGCGSGMLSKRLYDAGATREVEGMDASAERIQEAERIRASIGAPGRFLVGDANVLDLSPESYDLIVSAHSFHHFLELERVMDQVLRALTPRGLFILEEFVGPTQFQWTDAQIEITKNLTALLPERYRRFRRGDIKPYEARPTVEDVVAVSPFESIRSAEIVPLFERYFQVLHRRNLGGTIQHLLYNGIIHNFTPDEPEADVFVYSIRLIEDALIDSGMLPSDFQLLVGMRPDQAAP
jgi:ubiquinone/menaquinone biosynthesis C-methylase UbiE